MTPTPSPPRYNSAAAPGPCRTATRETGRPPRARIVPAHQSAPASPAVATARQLQQHLAAAYQIAADIRSHRGVAMLMLGRTLNVWCTGGRIMWDSGTADPATGAKVCASVPADQADQAAALVAGRFHQLHAGQG